MALGRISTYVCICGGDRSSVENRGLEKLGGSFQCEPSGVLQKDSHHQAELWSGEVGTRLRIRGG